MKIFTVVSVMMVFAVLPCMGQKNNKRAVTDVDAAIKGIEKIIKNEKGVAASTQLIESVVAEICEKQKKNPDIYWGAANAFWYKSRDSLNAFRYADKALELNSKYIPSYLLKGEIISYLGDTVTAENWYRKGIAANPTDTRCYVRIARLKAESHPEEAVTMLTDLKNAVPTFPCNREIARMYERRVIKQGPTYLEDMNMAVKYYELAEQDSMQAIDYVALAGYYNGMANGGNAAYFSRMLEVSEQGLAKFPNDFYLNRTALMAAVNAYDITSDKDEKRKIIDRGLSYGEKVFAVGDTLISASDYKYYGSALLKRNKTNEAIKVFTALISDFPSATDQDRSYAVGKIASAYKELGEYDKADEAYTQYIADREKKGTLAFADLWNFAEMYRDKAMECNGQEKIDAYMKADELYGRIPDKFLNNAALAYYRQIEIRTQPEIDPDYKKGLAEKPALAVYSLMQTKADLTNQDKAFLERACRFLGWYYYNNLNNSKRARPYWIKLHELLPEDTSINNLLRQIYKIKL